MLFKIRFNLEIINDKIKGVDFTAPVSKEDAGTSEYEEALYYASSGYIPEIDKALKYLRITSRDSIIDYGCGKGAVFPKFSKYPFRRVVGIELSENLVEICHLNMKKLGLNNVEIFQGDATKFEDIDDLTHFYFFNPFSGRIFDSVINNIIESGKRKPRSIILIYNHPKCHENVMKTGRFERIKDFNDGARKLFIYKYI